MQGCVLCKVEVQNDGEGEKRVPAKNYDELDDKILF